MKKKYHFSAQKNEFFGKGYDVIYVKSLKLNNMTKKEVLDVINEVLAEVDRDYKDAIFAMEHPKEYMEKYGIEIEDMSSKDNWDGYATGLMEVYEYIYDIKEKMGLN